MAEPDVDARHASRANDRVRGIPRNPGMVITAAILTLGLYGGYYWFNAFREVDHQNGRRHSALGILVFVPLLGLVFAFLYLRDELAGLTKDLAALEQSPRYPTRGILLWGTVGVLALVGPAIAMYRSAVNVNQFWSIVYARHGVAWPTSVKRPASPDDERAV